MACPHVLVRYMTEPKRDFREMKDLCEASYYRHFSNVIYFKITFLNLLHYVELYLCHAAQ